MTGSARFERCVRVSILCVQLLSGILYLAPARAAAAYSEDAVKADYLYRFAGYVDWPGARGLIQTLRHRGRRCPGGRPRIEASGAGPPDQQSDRRQWSRLAASRTPAGPRCYSSEAGHAALLRPALSELEARSTLVVTDEAGGLDEGGTLNFLPLGHRVGFEVSLIAADRAHLKISAELLAVAIRVFGGGRQSQDARGLRPECGFWNECTLSSRLGPS